jgi:hypothetical protein
MVMEAPTLLSGRSMVRSSTIYGFVPLGNVNRSMPARRVLVASIWMLLLSVNEK